VGHGTPGRWSRGVYERGDPPYVFSVVRVADLPPVLAIEEVARRRGRPWPGELQHSSLRVNRQTAATRSQLLYPLVVMSGPKCVPLRDQGAGPAGGAETRSNPPPYLDDVESPVVVKAQSPRDRRMIHYSSLGHSPRRPDCPRRRRARSGTPTTAGTSASPWVARDDLGQEDTPCVGIATRRYHCRSPRRPLQQRLRIVRPRLSSLRRPGPSVHCAGVAR